MGDARDHWENVYAAKSETAASWYQPHSVRSLELIEQASPDRKASVIDVGGGASALVDDLVGRGFTDVTVLDIAESALARAKARLGKDAGKVAWMVGDITRWTPPRTWDVWHDRAAFHFLTETSQQDAYIAALMAATRPGATAIISTFALDGPQKCSGLPVQRYSAESLAVRLGSQFTLVTQARETHLTPLKSAQHFSYAVFKRELKSVPFRMQLSDLAR